MFKRLSVRFDMNSFLNISNQQRCNNKIDF